MTIEEDFERFWSKYRKFNSTGKARANESFKKAREKWLKSNEGKDFIGFLMPALMSDEKHRSLKQKRGDFVPHWPMAATYLNQERFLDEFEESKSEIINDIENQESVKCYIAGCDDEFHLYHSSLPLCAHHYRVMCPNPYRDELRAAWNRITLNKPLNEGESWVDWYARVYRKDLTKLVGRARVEMDRTNNITTGTEKEGA